MYCYISHLSDSSFYKNGDEEGGGEINSAEPGVPRHSETCFFCPQTAAQWLVISLSHSGGLGKWTDYNMLICFP